MWAFRKFSALFSRQYGCLRQRHFTEEEILEKIFTWRHELNVTIGKSSQNSSKTTLEQYWLDESWLRYLTWKIRQNCWQGRISIFFTSFFEIQYAITQRGSLWSTCFMGHFESVFRALFSCGIYIVNKQDTTKACFLIILTLWSNPYMHNSCLGISGKYLIFRNAPKPIIDLFGISVLCANFETFTIFSAIVLKTCTYLPY